MPVATRVAPKAGHSPDLVGPVGVAGLPKLPLVLFGHDAVEHGPEPLRANGIGLSALQFTRAPVDRRAAGPEMEVRRGAASELPQVRLQLLACAAVRARAFSSRRLIRAAQHQPGAVPAAGQLGVHWA